MEPEIVNNCFENVVNNAGFQHLAENIFSYLNYKDLQSCQCINRSSKSILANPRFWLQKFIQLGMSKKNQNDWIQAIQLTKDTDFETNIQLYLKKSFSKGKIMNIPCCIDENALQMSCELIKKFGGLFFIIVKCMSDYVYNKIEFEDFSPGCFQALAALDFSCFLSSNSNRFFYSLLAGHGNLNMMKVISPLLSNPNIPEFIGDDDKLYHYTPFTYAARYGQLEIIKFLEPISDNLTGNALQLAISQAKLLNQNHVVEYLKTLSFDQ